MPSDYRRYPYSTYDIIPAALDTLAGRVVWGNYRIFYGSWNYGIFP